MLLRTEDLERIMKNLFSLAKMSVRNGSKYYGTGAVTSVDITSFTPREDTVISAMSGVDINGATVNYLTFFRISGITLKVTDLFIVPDGGSIKSFTIDSGSIIANS